MNNKYPDARARMFEAVRALSSSPASLQSRLIDATESLLAVTIDEFAGDPDLRIKFARLLDMIAVDHGDMKEVAAETAAYMTDDQASVVAGLICDFFYEIA